MVVEDFMEVVSMEGVSTAKGLLDMDTTVDTTADGAVAASTPRSFVPPRHTIVVFRN
jgi:hypothetical protein